MRFGFRPLAPALLALLSLCAPGAHAQSAPGAAQAPEAPPSKAERVPSPEGTEQAAEAPAAEAKPEAEQAPAPAAEVPAATAAPAYAAQPTLRADAQTPVPVALDDAPEPPSRALEVGAFVGIANRPSEGDLVTYGPTVAWGIYARPEIRSWLGVRLYYREESIPVTVDEGGFDTAASDFGKTDFEQDNLHLRSLGALAEPTWVVAPRLRLKALLGIAWLRFTAPAPSSEGEVSEIQTAKRNAVELDYICGLGASFDLIPNWFAVGASFTYGIASQRTGNAHQEIQAFSGGRRYSLGPLPRFDGVTDLLFNFGLIL